MCHSLEFRFRRAEDAVVIIHVWAAVAGVLKLHAVQVHILLLHIGRWLCRILLRVQHLHKYKNITYPMALQLHSQTTRPTQDSDTHLIWNSEPLQKSHHTLLKVLLLKHRRTNAEPQVRLWPSSELLRPVQKTAAATAEPNLVILPAVDTFAVLAGYRFCSVCSCKSIIKQHHPPSAFWGFHLLLWLAEPYNIHHLLFRFVEKQLIIGVALFL